MNQLDSWILKQFPKMALKDSEYDIQTVTKICLSYGNYNEVKSYPKGFEIDTIFVLF